MTEVAWNAAPAYEQPDVEPQVEKETTVNQTPETEEPIAPVKTNTDTIGEKWTNKIPVLGQVKWAGDVAAQGTGDTIFDAIGAVGNRFDVPWLKRADEWWDANNPKSNDPFHTLVRDVSAVVVPSIVANRVLVGGLAGATKARNINSATRTLGSILAQAGIETSIAAITSQSYEQDNAAGALNKMFGWNIPWGTDDAMGPEQRRHLHMYEAGAFSAAVDLTGAAFAFGKALKKVNADQNALQLLEADAAKLKKAIGVEPTDEFTTAVEGRKAFRELAKKDEAIKRLSNQIDNTKYDPFVNDPARPEQRAISPDEFDVDAVGAKADQYAIQNNIGTIDGIMRPSASKELMQTLTESRDITQRAAALGGFFDNELSANADVILNGKQIPGAELNKAVDNLVENLFDPNVTFKQFQQAINEGRTLVHRGHKLLNEDAWITASQAWQRAHRELFNPNNLRASAMVSQQAADVVSTTARSIKLLDGIGTSSRQWEIMSQKMKLLVGEVTASKDVIRRGVELRSLVQQGDFQKVAQWLNVQSDSFESALLSSRNKAFSVIDEIENIAKEHPEYMRPLAEAYDATNGDINTLHKLHQFAEANIGLLKKGIFDRHPEMPSFFIRGLHSIRYNSILNGLSPLRALVGNSIVATVKPISVLAGAFASGDVATFKKGMYTYGGFIENFKRGFKVMGDDWRLANSNPELAVKRGRHDFKALDMEKFQTMETMADAWRLEGGKDGKVAMWNAAKMITHYSNWKVNRWGINGLYAIDGLFKSLMASGSSRAKAYDTLFSATNGSFNKAQFQDLQQHLYNQAFDKNGLLLDKAADFASKELALNLDYNYVDKFDKFLNHVPAAKALFMFPRTGVNGFELTWSFNPLSNIGPAITRARRTLAATTPGEIAEVLAEHGLDNTPEAFRTLQAEYIGRQLMGGAVVFGAGIWALEGNITGHGPQDPAERQRMISMGWKPLSIKNPFTGTWHSYRGLEPFTQILSMVGDMTYYSDRVDQSVAEDWFRKLGTAITANTTNQTLTGGLEPLVSLFSGNERAWNRFLAQTTDTMLPQRGVRTILNNIISPQLRDVKNEFGSYLMNYNKFMFPDQPALPNMVDAYTGKPIRFHEKLTAAANALTPIFKSNGGMEPWRQWLLATGWDGLSRKQIDEVSGYPLEPHARQWINNWIGKHGGLKGRVIEIMETSPDKWESDLAKYKKGLGLTGKQEDTPIKEMLLHRALTDVHSEVFRHAFMAYRQWLDDKGATHSTQKNLKRLIKNQLRSGDTDAAFETRDKLLQYK